MGYRAISLVSLVVAASFSLVACPANEKAPPQAVGAPPAQPTNPVATPPPASPIPASWVGDAMDFSFTTFAGETVQASSFAGKPLVLNFWASW